MDRLLGREPDQPDSGQRTQNQPMTDEQAVERYRYMLRTAPPEDIERAHAEAFAQLTPEQRRAVLAALSAEVPESEAQTAADDPQSLARLATRAEMRRPGTLERSFGSTAAPGMGMGSMFLTMVAGSFVGTAIAQSFFDDQGSDSGAESDAGAASDADSDGSGMDEPGVEGDYGGDMGGGDIGGGDFGDGDFGGGDFG